MKTIKQEFVRYVGVGGVAFIADFTLLAILVGSSLHYLPAVILAFVLGSWVNYLLSVRWVFAYRAVDTPGTELGVFMLVGVITLGLSLALMALLIESLAMHVLMAKCLVAAFTLVTNFTGRRALLFTRWGRAPMVSS